MDPFCGPERGEWVFDVCLEIEQDGGVWLLKVLEDSGTECL